MEQWDEDKRPQEVERTFWDFWAASSLRQIDQDARHDRRRRFLHGGSKKKGPASQFPTKTQNLKRCFCIKKVNHVTCLVFFVLSLNLNKAVKFSCVPLPYPEHSARERPHGEAWPAKSTSGESSSQPGQRFCIPPTSSPHPIGGCQCRKPKVLTTVFFLSPVKLGQGHFTFIWSTQIHKKLFLLLQAFGHIVKRVTHCGSELQ